MRMLAILLCMVLFSACGSPRRESADQEQKLQEELKEEDVQESDEPTEHKAPDGAFGAKDYASETREQSDQNTKALEEAAEVQDR